LRRLSDVSGLSFRRCGPGPHAAASSLGIRIDAQAALRDSEKDLSSWRNSPLRPLIEELATSLDEEARVEIQEQVNEAQAELVDHDEVVATAERIGERLRPCATFAFRPHCQATRDGLALS
jgi:hypothetical protein